MPKNDSDLFDRLRQAGLRRQVAKTLSGIGEGAGNKALRAARNAVTELRSLADELERRLPSSGRETSATRITAGRDSVPSSAVTPPRASRPRPSRPRTGTGTAASASRGPEPSVMQRARAAAPRDGSAALAGPSGARAPRGQNKARILESLRAGPKTASEIAKDTGIGTGTVSTTLTKLAKSGELVKADRGYRLPG